MISIFNQTNRKMILFSVSIISLLFISCTTNNDVDEKVDPNYFPMNVGNYWIYNYYEIDSLGNEKQIEGYDSILITKDTLINNRHFWWFRSQQTVRVFGNCLADSAGYLIDQTGNKYFSSTNFTDTLMNYDLWNQVGTGPQLKMSIRIVMQKEAVQKTTPLATFTALVAREYVTFFNTHDKPCRLTCDKYYCKDVGLVVDTYTYNNYEWEKKKYEKRLVRYKLIDKKP